MKLKLYFFGCMAVVIFLVSSCERPPELSVQPRIEFFKVEFVEQFPGGSDSLYVTIKLEDGDGDLGLEADMNDDPYHPVNYFDSLTGQPLSSFNPRTIKYGFINARGEAIRTANPQFDTLPDYDFPEICFNYESVFRLEFIPADSFLILYPDTLEFNSDTLYRIEDIYYIQRNPNHNNIFVDFFIEQGGQFVPFDFSNLLPGSCNLGYDARFPSLSESINEEQTLQGELRYGMLATSWRGILRNNNIKLRVFIKDRARNDSNQVESNAFTLDDVKIN